MKAIREDKHCRKCNNIVDRKGILCMACYIKSIIRARQKYSRETRKATIQLQAMKKQVYDKILKEVNEELDREESEKRK